MNELHEWIYLNTEDSAVVVEFGAGFFDKLTLTHPNVVRKIGIEAHLPYIQAATLPEKVEIVHGDMREFDNILFPDDMTDTALFVDTLEHLTRDDAVSLIERVQRTFRKILLFVPEGNHPQTKDMYNMGGDDFQTHRSTWTMPDVLALGFQKVVVDPNYHNEPGKDNGAIFGVWTRESRT